MCIEVGNFLCEYLGVRMRKMEVFGREGAERNRNYGRSSIACICVPALARRASNIDSLVDHHDCSGPKVER